MQFNKINQPVYTAIANYSTQSDDSISVRYIVGTGASEDLSDFQLICESWKYVSAEHARELLDQPLTADDLGKTPNEIILGRIYDYLKANNEIVIQILL